MPMKPNSLEICSPEILGMMATKEELFVLTMAVLRRTVIVILLWLPALRSKFFLCVCHPVYACAVSMRVPVNFIAITVLISIDLLTVLVVVTPELLTNVVFFSIPLPEGESERDPKRG